MMFPAFETDEDMDAFELEVTSKCLNQSGHNPPDNLTYETVMIILENDMKNPSSVY